MILQGDGAELLRVITWIFVRHVQVQSRNANQSKNTSRNETIVQENNILPKGFSKKQKSHTSQLQMSLLRNGSRGEIFTKQQKLLL